MAVLISRTIARQRHRERGVVLLGVALQDRREEAFCLMVCDGLSIGMAFERAGFTSKKASAPSETWALERVQKRAAAILEARRTTGVVTLPEVTSMLKRVFAKAYHNDEMNAAHNAAFSLARLYGHVTDRAQIDILRKPSRDPDAPAEASLGAWIEALPGAGPGLEPDAPEALANPALEPVSRDAQRAIEPSPERALTTTYTRIPPSPEPSSPEGEKLSEINWLGGIEGPSLEGSAEKVSDIKGLEGDRPSENGAPTGPVTGTPNRRAREAPPPQSSEKPNKTKRVPVPAREKRKYKLAEPSSEGAKRPKKPLSGAAKRKKKRMKELFG